MRAGMTHAFPGISLRHVESEFRWQLFFPKWCLAEKHSPQVACGVHLHPQRLSVLRPCTPLMCIALLSTNHKVRTVGLAGEIGEVELQKVPAILQAHGHRADKGLDARDALCVGIFVGLQR